MNNLTTQLSRIIIIHLKRNRDQKKLPILCVELKDLDVYVKYSRDNGRLRLAGGGYNDVYRTIKVDIIVPFEFNDRELSDFIPVLKNTIRHELEHHRQYQRSGYEEPFQF